MEPITREEYYLAKIAGTYKGKTPEPVTIDEYYLATMAGDYSGNTPQPVTRLQYYMAKVAGVWGGSIPAPVTRLEYYWAAIASGEGKVFPPVTREEHFLVLVADAYSVVLTVVTGNPALLENSKGNRGLESLTLYGKSTQGRTTGAQLLPFEVGEKREGFEVFKDGIAISGAGMKDIYAVGREDMTNESSYDDFPLLASGEYYIYLDIQDVKLYVVVWRKGTNVILGYSTGSVAKKIEVMDGDKFRIFLRIEEAFNGKVKAMITRIPVNATSYEPYKPAQTLIIPTPGGLPGIPVSSGGNYTDEKGQQWVADEIDLAKGERVQWIGNKVLQESDLKKDTPDSIFVTLYNIKTVSNANPICSHLKYVPYQTADKKQILCISRVLEDIRIYLNSADFQVYKDFVNNNEVFLIWALKTPIRTPIPPETIAAYKALHTYSPTTTVINDAGAGMSVGYAKMK
jgi:hypothetical protein